MPGLNFLQAAPGLTNLSAQLLLYWRLGTLAFQLFRISLKLEAERMCLLENCRDRRHQTLAGDFLKAEGIDLLRQIKSRAR